MRRGNYDARDGTDRMVFEEPLGPVVRIVLGFFGATTFLAPWDLLIRPGHVFALAALPFWIISVGALSVGVPLLLAALLGPQRRLVVDFERRLFVDTTCAAFGLHFERQRRFDDLEGLDIVEDTFSDGPSRWELRARFAADRKPWAIRTLESEAAAHALAAEMTDRMERDRAT